MGFLCACTLKDFTVNELSLNFLQVWNMINLVFIGIKELVDVDTITRLIKGICAFQFDRIQVTIFKL